MFFLKGQHVVIMAKQSPKMPLLFKCMAKLISKLEITSISLRACQTSLGRIVTTIYTRMRLGLGWYRAILKMGYQSIHFWQSHSMFTCTCINVRYRQVVSLLLSSCFIVIYLHKMFSRHTILNTINHNTISFN